MAGTATVLGGSFLANTSLTANSGSGNAQFSSMGCGGRRSSTSTEVQCKTKTNSAGVLSKYCLVVTTLSAGTVTSFVRVNAADVTQTVVSGTATTGQYTDSTHTDTIASGDFVGMRWFYSSAFPTVTLGPYLCNFVATSGSYSGWSTDVSPTSAGASTTTFFSLVGSDSSSGYLQAAETNQPYEIRAATTAGNLRCFISANTSTNAVTVTARKTGADGAQTLSLTAATTGAFEDTTHTDSLTTTDTYGGKWVTGAGTSNTAVVATSVSMTNTGAAYDVLSGDASNVASVVTSADSYFPVLGSYFDNQAIVQTEANAQVTWPQACTMSHMRIFASTNSSLTGTTTLTFRIGGAAGNQTVTITNSVTGLYEDTTHSDTVAAGNLLNYRLTHPTAGTLVTERCGVTPNSQTSNTETGTAVLAFGPLGFNAAGTRSGVGHSVLAFGPLAFNVAAIRKETGTAVLAFGAIKIVAAGFDIIKSTLRQFWTR